MWLCLRFTSWETDSCGHSRLPHDVPRRPIRVITGWLEDQDVFLGENEWAAPGLCGFSRPVGREVCSGTLGKAAQGKYRLAVCRDIHRISIFDFDPFGGLPKLGFPSLMSSSEN